MVKFPTVTTLKLVLRTPRFVLVGKALLLTILFAFATMPDGSFFWFFVFFITALYYYFHSPFNHLAYVASFTVLLALALLLPTFFDLWTPLVLVPLFVAWFILFGLQTFFLIERWWWHYFLFVILSYGVTLWYVVRIDAGGGMLASTMIAAVFFSLLLNELWGAELPYTVSLRKRLALIAVSALLLLQGVWMLRLLPLPILLVAAIALFAFALFTECVVRFYSGERLPHFFLRRCALFFGFVVLVFLTSRWSL